MAKKQLGPTTNLFPMPAVLVAVKTGEDARQHPHRRLVRHRGRQPAADGARDRPEPFLDALHRGVKGASP